MQNNKERSNKDIKIVQILSLEIECTFTFSGYCNIFWGSQKEDNFCFIFGNVPASHVTIANFSFSSAVRMYNFI